MGKINKIVSKMLINQGVTWVHTFVKIMCTFVTNSVFEKIASYLKGS